MRDVFYLGKKPNVHPREKFAKSIHHARQQCTTEHFWIINEFCDYKGFDWDFEFHFLPDEDVWAEAHNNVWPSQWQKDSGTWLCPEEHSDVIIYRADVPPIKRKNEITEQWVFKDKVDTALFDFSWHPDSSEPPYIYVFGNQYYSSIDMPTLEYHTDGATDYKFITDIACTLAPKPELFELLDDVVDFDYTWRPDPHSPPYIYVWGCEQHPATIYPVVKFVVPSATEYKFIENVKAKLAQKPELFETLHPVKDFDYSWRPDPTDPPYIYVWGNQWYPGTIMPTVRYVVPGATEIKHIDDSVAILAPDSNRFEILEKIDDFDFSWVPDPTSPPYIYVFGNQWYDGTIMPTIEYHCGGATDRKYVTDVIAKLANMPRIFDVLQPVENFDFSWRPNPKDPPYNYVFGNNQYPGTVMPTVQYRMAHATDTKYVTEIVAELAQQPNKFEVLESIESFDYSWVPDPTSPPYIYVWGNQWHSPEKKASVVYKMHGATEYKYMSERLTRKPDMANWSIPIYIHGEKFDFSWEPDPTSPPYIYEFGTQWQKTGGPRYNVPGATEIKYEDSLKSHARPSNFQNWEFPRPVDLGSFDFSWHPDSTDEPFIYQFGTQHQKTGGPRYIVPGASVVKYIDEPRAKALALKENWVIPSDFNQNKFDFSWHPDDTEQPYVYAWGNKWVPSTTQPMITYVVPGATEMKHVHNEIELEPQLERWKEIQSVDLSKFDLTWRADPSSPPYIYIWGNKHIPGELKSTIEYHVPGATEKKYIQDPAPVLPETDRWKIVQAIDESKFDFTWRPDPREPAYIYVWGNKHVSGELKSTIEYHCPGAKEKKFLPELVEVLPELENWNVLFNIDKSKFDFTWRPDPTSPPYIYIWGNQHNKAEVEPTVEYHVPGATEKKFINDGFATTVPVIENYKTLIPVESFDYSWRPDPGSPPYIYVFGNQWHDATTEPTIEYHVPNATEKKYVTDIIATVSRTQEHWKTLIEVESFDYSWRPNPHSSPYIYVFGNQWHEAVIEPTIEYHQPGATDRKYVTDVVAISKSTATDSHWRRLIPVESFDYSWRPDPHSPPYIYVFGNKWNDSATEPSVEYYVEGATERKYVNSPVAVPLTELQYWAVSNQKDLETFDFSWRPNPHSPPQIYQWADNGPRYTVPGATDVVYVERTVESDKATVNRYKIETTLEDLIAQHPEEVFWAINPDLSYDKFDFSWRPNEENFRHINVFGNEYSKNTQTYYVNGPMYMMGHREYNYVEELTVSVDSNLSMFYIDRGNKESQQRFDTLKIRYPQIQKTRYLNTWVDTITRCINKSSTKLFWVLNSELDYNNFEFDFYPSQWQMKMVHVFGTQWSHWGNTYMVNKETFANDTKYVKIIEHLTMLNFVKSKKATATNCLYDIIVIDHGNDYNNDIKGIPVTKITFDTSYLKTFKKMLETLPTKNEHYVWVCSSICDYGGFDFTYICDPYAKDQLHVFPSDRQKFGDTFLVDVNKLRTLIADMTRLEDYEKVNYNPHMRVQRLPAPTIVVEDDTHCDISKYEYNFPYADFITVDNKLPNNNSDVPMSIWAPDHRNIIIKSTGGTKITAPKDVKDYVSYELYDYPYISRSEKLMDSRPLDIVFLSNGETGADENYEHLLDVTSSLPNRVVRVDGVNGRVASYHAAAKASETPWMFTVFAKLRVNPRFDWTWQPDRLQVAKHYIFNATNPVNGLEYGHQAMIAYNKKIVLGNQGTGLDFTLDNEHEVVDMNSGVAMFNTDEWSTWRTAFREAIKLRASSSDDSKYRLDAWLTKGEGPFAQYSINGAVDAVEYYESVNGDLDKLRLSYDWPWLKEYFNTKYI